MSSVFLTSTVTVPHVLSQYSWAEVKVCAVTTLPQKTPGNGPSVSSSCTAQVALGCRHTPPTSVSILVWPLPFCVSQTSVCLPLTGVQVMAFRARLDEPEPSDDHLHVCKTLFLQCQVMRFIGSRASDMDCFGGCFLAIKITRRKRGLTGERFGQQHPSQ